MSHDATYLRPYPEGCILTVRIHPGARRNAIAGIHDEALKISLTAPAVDGKANAALIAYLAELLDLPKSNIILIQGTTSRSKTLKIFSLDVDAVQQALSTQIP
jgi:uncharacterized protein (TIGR00251 family)